MEYKEEKKDPVTHLETVKLGDKLSELVLFSCVLLLLCPGDKRSVPSTITPSTLGSTLSVEMLLVVRTAGQ